MNSCCATFFISFTQLFSNKKNVNFKSISKIGYYKDEVGQNNKWQKTELLLLIQWHKEKIRGHEMLTHTFTKRIEDKTNQNSNSKKIDRKNQL